MLAYSLLSATFVADVCCRCCRLLQTKKHICNKGSNPYPQYITVHFVADVADKLGNRVKNVIRQENRGKYINNPA